MFNALQNDIQLFDVRSENEFNVKHIQNAINIENISVKVLYYFFFIHMQYFYRILKYFHICVYFVMVIIYHCRRKYLNMHKINQMLFNFL